MTNRRVAWGQRMGPWLGYGAVAFVLAGAVVAIWRDLRRPADLETDVAGSPPESFFAAQLRARPATSQNEPAAASVASAIANPVRIGSWLLEDRRGLSTANLRTFMERFVREPHPMGSEANRSLARDMVFLLKSFGWQASLQPFTQPGPNLDSPRFGGKKVMSQPHTMVSGENVVAFRSGRESCVIILGGHYDTKRFDEFRFVGANDGGSSTALMLELARLIPKVWPERTKSTWPKGTWRSCGVALVFFDGEEALLPGWYDGMAQAGIEDNTYGSRYFARRLEEGGLPWGRRDTALAVIIDMVGHRNQKLFITEGSDPDQAARFEALRGEVDLRRAPFRIDDDHMSLMRRGIPVVHIIDWTNLEEWHKATDTPDIISYEKLALFGDVIMGFLQSPRRDVLARRSP